MIGIVNPVKVSNVMKYNTIVSLICQETPKTEVRLVLLLPENSFFNQIRESGSKKGQRPVLAEHKATFHAACVASIATF